MTPCIEAPGCRTKKGYARKWTGGKHGKQWKAHRLAWTLARGPIPPGMHVLHRCDNPPCINVEHLFLGTNRENIADRVNKGRSASRERAPGAKLKEADITTIRYRLSNGESGRSIARDYRVDQSTISDINTGTTWKVD